MHLFPSSPLFQRGMGRGKRRIAITLSIHVCSPPPNELAEGEPASPSPF